MPRAQEGREQFHGETRLSRNFISQSSDFKLKISLRVAGPPGDMLQAARVHCGVRSSEDVMASRRFQNLERIPGQRGPVLRMHPFHSMRCVYGGVGRAVGPRKKERTERRRKTGRQGEEGEEEGAGWRRRRKRGEAGRAGHQRGQVQPGTGQGCLQPRAGSVQLGWGGWGQAPGGGLWGALLST